ncbi:hypothetical protein [Brevibacillus choshinensis]|uniref:hypothetical protein n=1 Tax=Brevibacillus choshinensis TaxID=54911 RepID=UPI000A6CEC59|nr:hypothetical protein [Brevibacillus choshinensis]
MQHATARTYQSACELIEPLAERLGKVNIESKDYSVIIEKYDHTETFFYIDLLTEDVKEDMPVGSTTMTIRSWPTCFLALKVKR